MSEQVDLDAWRKDGENLWAAIQENDLVVIYWNNPWYRFALPGGVLVLAAIVTAIIWRSAIVSGAMGALSLPFVMTAAKYFIIGMRTGGLYSFFSEKGFGVGCDADRISFPYSAIRLPDTVAPSTVNENYIVLPVRAERTDVTIERKDGVDTEWDGEPYRRGIASVHIKDNVVCVRAYPNEMIVQLFCAIYPLSLFLASKNS
jgi:hypothetical protein